MTKLYLFFSLTIMLFSCGCSDDSSNYSDKPYSPYIGVSTYDNDGKKVSEEDDDWYPECYEIAGFGDSHMCFYSIYPLPALDTITVSIASRISGRYRVWIALNDTTKLISVFDKIVEIGDFKVKVPFDDEILYRDVIYRLFVESTDTSNQETQLRYGDVIWE